MRSYCYVIDPIVIYCETGNRSNSAYELLKKDGFNNTFTLKGGFRQWLSDKLPIDKKPDNIQAIQSENQKKKSDK